MAEQLGDRVSTSSRSMSSASFVDAGYQGFDVQVGGGKTVHLSTAPGLRLSTASSTRSAITRCWATDLPSGHPRPRGRAGTKVGFAEDMSTLSRSSSTPEYVKAAERATRELNAAFLTVMLEGRYTDTTSTKPARTHRSSPTTS